MIRRLFFLAWASLLTGCGTLANINGNDALLGGTRVRSTRPFGGVANDARWIGEMGRWLAVFDLPFSVVGDVVTVPAILIKNSLAKH